MKKIIISTLILFPLINAMEKDMEYNYLDNIPDELKVNIAEHIADDSSPEVASENLRALRGANRHWKNFIDNNTDHLIQHHINQYDTTTILTAFYLGTPTALNYGEEHLKEVHGKDDQSKVEALDRALRRAFRTYSGSKQTNIIMYKLVKNGAKLLVPDQNKSYVIEDQREPQPNGTLYMNDFLINTYKQADGSLIHFGGDNNGFLLIHADKYLDKFNSVELINGRLKCSHKEGSNPISKYSIVMEKPSKNCIIL